MSEWQRGTVYWFDEISGEGMIRSIEGNLFYVHHSAIESFISASKPKRALLKENQEVKFKLLNDLELQQVAVVSLVTLLKQKKIEK